MRYFPLLGHFAGLMAAATAYTFNELRVIEPVNASDYSKPKRRRTGSAYPHSSTRQRARYARQIAAGQIKNAA